MKHDDYIKRSNAINAIKGLPTWWADQGGIYGNAQPPMEAMLDPEDAVSAIENIPSADVQPVVHGEWISNGDPDSNGNALYKCSICHFKDKHAVHLEVPYCWHCGARMGDKG